jgi:hypothetical protein
VWKHEIKTLISLTKLENTTLYCGHELDPRNKKQLDHILRVFFTQMFYIGHVSPLSGPWRGRDRVSGSMNIMNIKAGPVWLNELENSPYP